MFKLTYSQAENLAHLLKGQDLSAQALLNPDYHFSCAYKAPAATLLLDDFTAATSNQR